MSKLTAQNTAVIVAAIGAALVSLYVNTDWLAKKPSRTPMRERCYGITRVAKNDCATAKHSCASQAITNRSSEEFIMLPKGLCERIVGGRVG